MATIRRDFDHLARQQLIHRARGGAAPTVGYELPLSYKATRRATEKQRIAAAASALVQPGQVVGLNGGTTAAEVTRAIASRPDIATQEDAPRLTVVTNAVNIAHELTVRPYIKLVVTGGVARPQSYELTGPLARQTLSRLKLDIAFLGAEGVDPEGGITAQHEGEAEVNALIAARARKVVVVADSTKLGKVSFALICSLSSDRHPGDRRRRAGRRHRGHRVVGRRGPARLRRPPVLDRCRAGRRQERNDPRACR